MPPSQLSSQRIETTLIKRRTLTADGSRRDAEHAIEADEARPARGVPSSAAEQHPIRFPSVILARQQDDQEVVRDPGDHHNGAVLALPGIVLVRHPRPHDLTRVGDAVRMRGVRDARRP